MNAKHSSDSAEHGTPPEYIEASRKLMKVISLDPASSKLANTVVKARRIYTIKDNGYAKRWRGNVLLNPPGGLCEFETGRPVYQKTKKRESCSVTGACGLPPGHTHTGVTSSAKAWWWHLVCDYMDAYVRQAVFFGFTLEIMQSTQVALPGGEAIPYVPQDFAYCIPAERMRFYAMDSGKLVRGDQPTHANIVSFLPQRWDKQEREAFMDLFSPFGKCTWPSVRVRKPL